MELRIPKLRKGSYFPAFLEPRRLAEKLRGLRLSKAAELVEAGVEETLTYYAFAGLRFLGSRR